MEQDFLQQRPSVFKSSSTLGDSFVHSLREWRHQEKTPRDDAATDVKALSIFPGVQSGRIHPRRLIWYRRWLDEQLRNLPDALLPLFLGVDGSVDLREFSPLMEIFLSVAGYLKTATEPSIDHAIEHLRDVGLVQSGEAAQIDSGAAQELLRYLVFTIVGWQTMLYQASFGTCPPQQLAVVDVLDGYRGQAFLELKQDHTGAKRYLDSFLMGFGLFLTPKNLCISEYAEECEAFEGVRVVGPDEMNFFLLNSIAHINIKWIDVLAPHMEYDKSTNTLFLFRYPSSCVANLPSQIEEGVSLGVIHSCAARGNSSSQWASEDDVTAFLREVLLSYRLLFGQSKNARSLFRTMSPFEDMPSDGQDFLLSKLCGRKTIDASICGKERSSYHLPQHFPILRFRIAVLKAQLSVTKAKGWKELWRDRRDSANWYTFWAVIIIGGVGLFFSLLQIMIGILQVVYGARSAVKSPSST